MYSQRRKPVCHKCNNYMEGHKRSQGSPVCPTNQDRRSTVSPGRSLISPPPSPTPLSIGDWNKPLTDNSFTSEKPSSFEREPSAELCKNLKFDKLPMGGYRRRNPNWESGADVTRQMPQLPNRNYRHSSPAVSVVSTVLVDHEPEFDAFSDVSSDDAESIVSASSDSSGSTTQPYPQTPLGRQSSFVGRIADYARFNKSMVTIFRAKKDELSTIQRGARRRGVHTATMPSSASSSTSSPYASPLLESDESTYVVLGKSRSFVEEVAERGHHSHPPSDFGSFNLHVMPGTLVRNPIMEGPRMITIPQLIFLMACTSCLVVFGLSLIS